MKEIRASENGGSTGKTDLVFGRRGKESINPAVILSDILLLCSLWPSGLALMSLSHSEPRIKVCERSESVGVCVFAFLCEGQKPVHRSKGEQEDILMSSFQWKGEGME